MTSPAVASPAWHPDAPRPPTLHREPKGTLATARHYVGDLVYGANDGLITTFAVVAGVAGGALSSRATLIIGAANLFADGLSMAVGNYLSIRSREGALAAQNLPEEKRIRQSTASLRSWRSLAQAECRSCPSRCRSVRVPA